MPYEDLKKFTFDKWVRLYDRFLSHSGSERGDLTGEGLDRPDLLRNVVNHCLMMAEVQYDPYYISAVVVKEIVGERLSAGWRDLIFSDGNRRMSLIYASGILEHFGRFIDVHSPNALKFKKRVRGMNVNQIERWVRTYSIAFKAPEPINRPNTRSDIRSNQASYSSSVISSKDTSPDINSLWQLHAESITMGDYEAIANQFYQAGWWTEARPSKRYKGRFDMFIKKR